MTDNLSTPKRPFNLKFLPSFTTFQIYDCSEGDYFNIINTTFLFKF